MRALKMRSALASHWKLTMTNWEQSLKLILLQLHEKLLKNSTLTILWSFSIWSKLERWKSLISECLMSWLKVKKLSFLFLLTLILILMTLILCNNKEPFLDWIVMYNDKCTLYNNWWWPSQCLDWKEAPKHFPKPNLHPKRSWSLVVCCPSDPLKLSESQWNHYIWEVCSANQWVTLKTIMPAASIGQHKGPNASAPQCSTTHCTTSTSKVEWIGLRIFAIFTWPPANRLPLLQTFQQLFARKMLPQPAGGRKCFPRVHQIPKHGFLLYRNKQTYFLLAKIWL